MSGSDTHSLALTSSNVFEQPTQASLLPALNPIVPIELSSTSAASYSAQDDPLPLIGVIDTGLTPSLMDIDPSQIIVGVDHTTDEFNHPHGSAVANTIHSAAEQNTLWFSNSVGSGQWANALTEFVDTAIATGYDQAIANLSFDLVSTDEQGTIVPRQSLTLEEANALDYAQQHNVIVVVAAGNSGSSIGALGQSSQLFENVITVGAADGLQKTDYSSYGTGLSILAPGGTSNHPLDTGIDGYQFFGTSASTAIVTGGIAELWESSPDLNYQQVVDIVEQSATDIYEPGPDLDSGAGIFNLEEALALAQRTNPELIEHQPSIDGEWEWNTRNNGHTERPLAVTLGKGTSGRLQAEDFQLNGYTSDNIGGIKAISTFREKGTASAKFGGQTGVYTLKVRYFDESDGEGTFEMKVGNQSYRWTANGNFRDNYPTARNGVIREFKNVVLTNGSTIQLIGHRDGGERARIDYVEFEPSSSSSPSPSPSTSPNPSPSTSPGRSPSPSPSRITIQAESFRLNGFSTENSAAASGNRLIKTSGTGRATTSFSGSTGTYDIKVNYFDEADGQAPLTLKAGGRSFNWSANQRLNGNIATRQNRTSRTFENIQLRQGSTIELGGQRQREEYARIDSIEFIPSDQPRQSPAPSPQPIEPEIISDPPPNRNGRANGEFQVRGEHIYDPSGREFIVKGVNKFTFDQGSSKQVDQIKNDWKFNTVRLNYFLEGESGQQLHSNIQSYSENEVVTIVELHDRTGKYWEGNDLIRLKGWFKDLAQRYKDNPYVWFNIANEPGGSKSAQQTDKWLRQHQEVIKVIRDDVGASNPIVVDAHFWGQDVGEWSTTPVKEAKSAILSHGDQIKRFGGKTYDNIIFSVHMYDQWNFGEAKMADYLDRIEDKDYAVIVGEYGQINNGFATREATDDMFKVTAPREIGRIAWVWSAKDSNDLTTTKNGGGEHINDDNNPTNLSWLGERVWADNRRSENLHRI